ncbi:glycosyltransferase family 8 protein [Macrolepiota fuliginosa MF-IS2]|uniref:Glycosyltransferase family 8 protein n=1 Tax=Macrolepiota fuliginosa MF-IS2 TaxID=1400762 RepID=A0A9P6C929_9AGAR|nr:glycosyltransferase family 8 protein [Macrolepiota fuliginosa MF-IS2]
MVGEPLARSAHRRTLSSQFTTSTYPGGPRNNIRHNNSSFSPLPPLTHRRRYLAISSLLILAIIFILKTSAGAPFHRITSVYSKPNLEDQVSSCGKLTTPTRTTIYGTDTVYIPGPTQTVTVQDNALIQPHPSKAVVFILIMWSKTSAIEGALLVKSILMYNTSPSEFHIICDDEAENYLRSRFALVHRPRQHILIRFYKPSWQSMLDRIEREGTIQTDHSAGLPGLMKLFIHEIVPVEKGIYIDTDAFFISDPTLLWNIFETLKPSTAVVMSSHPDQNSPEWNNASRICSCVMLLDLEKLRNLRLMDSSIYQADSTHRFPSALGPEAFRAMYGLPGGDGRGRYDNVRLGDQGYWWAIVSHRPDIFEPLSYDFEVTSCLLNTYNIGLGNDDTDESEELSRQSFLIDTPQEGIVVLPKLLHFNCLHGTDVYMNWEGWSHPDNILAQRWGAALKYHEGYKWIWLNNGGGSSMQMEATSVVFADEHFASEISL